MLTLEELILKMQGKNYSDIARKAGLTRAYISSIASGKRLNPSYETIKKLNEVLSDE